MTIKAQWVIAEVLQNAKLRLIKTNKPYLVVDKMLRDYYREWDEEEK